ncbi:MAG: 3-methylcrotonyl-CoA carboxylase, partial [Rhodospirillales bacterium]|nr:3-methylcrotonyl-CoA carboxylase [Rhodospirillales bacterium]
RHAALAQAAASRSGDPHSPWHLVSGWRMNDDNHHDLMFRDGEARLSVAMHYRRDGWLLDLPEGRRVHARGTLLPDGDLDVELDGVRRTATVVRHEPEVSVLLDGKAWRLLVEDPAARTTDPAAGAGRLTAPMPGKVTQVLVSAGQAVERGTGLLVLEAMKMEHTIRAPADGVVKDVCFAAGEQVAEGAELIVFEVAE